jgi:hypothetical protein
VNNKFSSTLHFLHLTRGFLERLRRIIETGMVKRKNNRKLTNIRFLHCHQIGDAQSTFPNSIVRIYFVALPFQNLKERYVFHVTNGYQISKKNIYNNHSESSIYIS